SQAIFDAVRPLAFALHCRPMDALRRHYGLPPLGPDLRRIYTDADLALFSDIPEVYGLYGDIPGGHFLGPVRWSPEVPLPDWWAALDPNKPLIYVTLGSSGDGRLLPRLLDRLARPGLQLAVATAGATVGVTAPDVFCADYLPGDAVAARAALVICNGGSPTCAQALAAGVPVLGVPGNLDQYLNMHYLEGQGVGLTLRNRELDGPNLKRTVDRLLGEPSFRRAAQSLAATLSRYDLAERLREALRRLTA
ncbi:MAG TPA: glycosyltransferase, partial [Zoogloea sp.]|uniref:glycosyltransferase n=1 Tax=Zoogloea sp. TaxID=49181 RepID=UPI002BF0B37E